MMTWRLIAWTLAIGLVSPAQSTAQTLVVSVAADSGDEVDRLAGRVEAELDRSGYPVVPRSDASARLEARHSRPSRLVSAAESEWIIERSGASLLMVATGRAREALEATDQLVQRVETSLDAVNRQEAVARKLLDGCLFGVRAARARDESARAAALAERCLSLVPDLEPEDSVHPPEVLAAYRSARARVEANGSLLEVHSEPSGCPVRINGRPQGVTPLSHRVPRGPSFAVQVECAGVEPSRVHLVAADSDTVRIRVDAEFDRALRTRPHVSFRLSDPSVTSQRLRYARVLGRQVNATRVWVVSTDGAGARHDVVDVASGRHTTAVRTPRVATGEVVRETVAFLTSDGRLTETESDIERTERRPSERTEGVDGGLPSDSRDATPSEAVNSPWYGWALGAAGILALGGSFGAYALTAQREDQLDDAAVSDIDYQAPR